MSIIVNNRICGGPAGVEMAGALAEQSGGRVLPTMSEQIFLYPPWKSNDSWPFAWWERRDKDIIRTGNISRNGIRVGFMMAGFYQK